MPKSLLRLIAAIAMLAALPPAAGPAGAGGEPPRPDEETLLYRPVADVRAVDAGGRPFRLSERWGRRPLLVSMVFTRCAEICPPFLSSLDHAVSAAGGAGDDYDVVVLSCDPRDTPADMAEVAARHGLAQARGWTFGVTSAAEVERLARSIGFWRRWDAARRQLDHPAMLAAVSQGRVARLLVGATVPPARLREVIWELRGRFVPTYPLPSEKVLFRCFGYDPTTGRLRPDWGFLLLLAPALAMVLTAAVIFRRGGRPEDSLS